MLQLRQYQQDMTDETRSLFRQGVKSVLLRLPTGGGKTLLTSNMLNISANKGNTSWFIVHRRELVEQTIQAFLSTGIKKFGVISSGYPEAKGFPIQIASIQTLINRHERFPRPKFIAWDECISGDSLLQTDVGLIKISDVLKRGASFVLSYNGRNIVWRRILAWRKTGRKIVRLLELSSGEKIYATGNHPIYTNLGWKNTSEIIIGDQILCLKKTKSNGYMEHCSEILPLFYQIKEANPQELPQIILQNNLNGQYIKQKNYIDSIQGLNTLKIQGMEKSFLEQQHLAFQPLLKYIIKLGLMVRKKLAMSGLMKLIFKDSHGGTVTMEATNIEMESHLSTQKDMVKKVQELPQSGSKKDLEKQMFINIKEDISILDYQKLQQKKCLMPLEKKFQSVCDIKWESVVSNEISENIDVYDISVEDTNCFFANNILVHNCHHVTAGTWAKIFRYYHDAYHIGMTATPVRLDGSGLRSYFSHMVEGPEMSSLIEQGYLAPYKIFAPSNINLSGVHTQMGDYLKSELATVVDRPAITGDAIKHYIKHAHGKRAVVFCINVNHSIHVVSQFIKAGIPAAHVDGETPKDERKETIGRFRNGEIKVLSNVELFGEGFDLPALEVAILLRPTQSLGLYLQQVGRSLRPSIDKKYAIILDHAGNCERHGLPDEEREWTLEGRDIRSGKSGNVSVKVCPKCFAAQTVGSEKCKYCGEAFEKEVQKIDVAPGELVEIDPVELRKKRMMAQGQCKTMEDLILLGKKSGFRHPERWAYHIMQARQKKKLEGSKI